MNKVDESHLPEAWRKINHYSLRIGWLHNRPKPSQLEFLEEIKQEHGKEISLEVTGHPGWWLHFNVITASSFDSLEEALVAAKSTLKNSELSAGVLNFDEAPGTHAPIRLSKSQRIKLIDQIMHEPKRESEEGIVREAFLQVDDYALSVWVEEIPYREEFVATFESAENPLRSLEGEVCRVYTTALDEDLDDEDLDDEDLEDENLDDEDDFDMDDLGEEEEKKFKEFLESLGKGEMPKTPLEIDNELDELEDLDHLDELDDLEDDEMQGEEWQEVAKGVVRLEGNTVSVGDWNCTVPASEIVYGTAFEQASFDLKETQLTILIEKENSNE